MNRKLVTLAAAAVGLSLFPATAAGFSFGVAAGEVTSSSAIVWARADDSGRVQVRVSPDRRFGDPDDIVRTTSARSTNDNTVQVRVTRLAPGRRYYYRFVQGDEVSRVGRFETAPRANLSRTVRFAYTGDADASRAPGRSAPFFNNFQVYGRMARERNDFNINLGDTIYSDTGVTGMPAALAVADKWAMYKQNLGLRNLQAVRSSAGMYNHWDDHEFINDFTVGENGGAIYRSGVRSFLDYMPARYTARDGLYRTVRWGANAELFFLDQRSFRSPKASAGGVCDNPDTGAPDLAPTAPRSKRNTFALLIPSLARPVSQQCLDTINSPDRTLLGDRQKAAFMRAVRASDATFKIIVNETPIQQFYGLPYDRWEGYAAERRELLTFLRDNVKNVVFLTTDTHANFYNDARFSTFPEEGGTVNSGMKEMVTGPVATNSFAREIDEATNSPGAGDLLTSVFFKPPPPDGVGMECAAADVYSYTQVVVTRRAVTLTPKDLNGRPVFEKGANGQQGPRCGPFKIAAK